MRPHGESGRRRGAHRAGRRTACALALLAALRLAAACTGAPATGPTPGAAPAADAPPTVILLSLDGTRPADVEGLPTLARIAREGARAEALVPAFPSNTFPNHVTFVTGVSPDRHGIVNNAFVDPERGLYRYTADPTWLEAEPLWSLLARAGLPSASFHWVGSEGAWRSGLGPRHWERFDGGTPPDEKIERVLAWLALAEPAERPRFVTMWWRGADATGHRFGPGAPEVAEALRAQDAALGRFVDALVARGLLAATTLLVVSDHGMARAERAIDLEAALRRAGAPADVVGGGGFATVRLRDPPADPAARGRLVERAVEAARGLGLEAFARGAGPPDLPLSNPRFGDLAVVAPLGVAILDGSRALAAPAAAAGLAVRGIHGHRPELPEMAGIFFALGRGVAPGAAPGRVRAVDVAPTVLALLGVPAPDWMEGRPVALGAPEG